MKPALRPSVRRALPILIALILVLTLPLAGCSRITSVVSRAVSNVLQQVRPAASAALPSTRPATTDSRPSSAVDSSLIPLDEFFAAPEYTDPTVSGDGRNILYRHIRPDGSADDVVVRNIGTGMETVVPFPAGTNGIPYFSWSGDSRHVLFMIDNSGDENYSIYSVDIASGESVKLFSRQDTAAIILGADNADPNGIYFKANARDAQFFDLYWGNVATGETKMVQENPGNITSWYFDHDGNFRIVGTTDDDGGEHVLLRREGAAGSVKFVPGDWKEILHWEYGDTENSYLMDFTMDGKRIFYCDSAGRNTAALMEMELATGRTTVIDTDPDYDITSAWLDLKEDRVTAVEYYGERSQWKALDPALGKKFERMRQINGGDFGFTSSSDDDRYWLIYFDNDTDGRSYYFVDSETGSSKYLFHETPVLKKYKFAKMEPIAFESSDGLDIHGYATFPAGQGRHNLPMVLLVHGGPQARDTWGFSPEVQWLANRGYLVLQVNFRGSTGYGKQFNKAGDREWGGKMQQDLTEAVDWAVEQGYADRSRVAIMGASYGGYAALTGAAFTPDVYACAIDMFGPSSLITLARSIPDYWQTYREQLYQSIGDPAKDEAFMKSRSPLYSVDKIKIPVLIAQGGNDVRVTRQEAEQMVNAMKGRGLSVDYMFFPDAGHGFNTTRDSVEFYSKAEKFLAEYIGGKAGE